MHRRHEQCALLCVEKFDLMRQYDSLRHPEALYLPDDRAGRAGTVLSVRPDTG